MFDDRSPIYLQIAQQLEDDIVSGALGPDEPVWSTNQYATTFRINPATAAKGLQQLVDEGLLYKRRGLGMFVSPGACERLLRQRRERFVDEVVVPMLRETESRRHDRQGTDGGAAMSLGHPEWCTGSSAATGRARPACCGYSPRPAAPRAAGSRSVAGTPSRTRS